MRVILVLILTLLFRCAPLTTTHVAIGDDNLYGDISDGQPDRDSLATIKQEGRVIGEGRFAVTGGQLTNIKVGEWKEYSNTGLPKTIGSYKIGSFLDCCIGGLCRSFYFYRSGPWTFYDEQGKVEFEITFDPTVLRIKTRCGSDSLTYGLIKTIPRKYTETLTTDKIYELQKIKFDNLTGTIIYTPLNGDLFIDFVRRE